ncbi:hypothetical protein BH18ACT2_BH18ACT2_23980 [soil metagenome]
MRGGTAQDELRAGCPSSLAAPTMPPAWWRRGRHLSDGTTLHWWKQISAVLVVYGLYELVRNKTIAGPEVAFQNALRVMEWQQSLGINHELAVQAWSLEWLPLIVFSNYFYGSVYLGATFGTIVWLYRRRSDAYPLWRNTLAFMTMLGLVGFAFFPLMPPRLLDVLGDGQLFGFVDTLVDYPTFWSFDSEAMRTVSNPFAAMPSLHCAWAFWGACALYPRVRSNWARGLAVAYPIVTVYVVVATGNHFILDAVGGVVIFVAGYGLARAFTRAGRGRPLSERDDDPREIGSTEPVESDQRPYRSIAVR